MKKLMTCLLCGLISLGAASAESVVQAEFHCLTGLFETDYSEPFSPLHFESVIFPIPIRI